MCPYRKHKSAMLPYWVFLPDEADQNRPLISETAGVINCVFIFRGGREHGTNFSTYEDLGARPIKRGQRRANQATEKNKKQIPMWWSVYACTSLRHAPTPLLPLCVCFKRKTAWFTRSHAASAQHPVNTIQFVIIVLIRVSHTQSTSYVCTHTPIAFANGCYKSVRCYFWRSFSHEENMTSLARKWHNVSDAMCSEFDWQVLFCSISWFGEHKKQSIKERTRERDTKLSSAVIRMAARLFVYMTASQARPWHLSLTPTAVTVINF